MALVGGRVDKLEAKRKEGSSMQEMNLTVSISEVEQDKKVAKISYSATMRYMPDVAEIVVGGVLFWEEDNEKKVKELVDEFKRSRVLPNEIAEEAVTAINYTVSAVGTLGAFALGITAPINTPRARISASQPTAQQPAATAS